MIYKKHIIPKNDLTSHIHLTYIQLAKESIEYMVVSGHCRATPKQTTQNLKTKLNGKIFYSFRNILWCFH